MNVRRGFVALLVAAFISLAFAPTQANAETLRVINRTGHVIDELYVSNSRNDDWGRDWLGSGEYIGYNQYRDFSMTIYNCYVDLKAISTRGVEFTYYGANICGGLTWTLR